MPSLMKKFPLPLKLLVFALAAVAVAELFLRFGFGFGEVPVYYSSEKYAYALSPDQDMRRFGNRFLINEAGMRSAPLDTGEFRILKFGDSVLNGGVSTDQSDCASSLLESRLDDSFPEKMRVLNVSSGSWGPDNAFAWMQAHGDFDARAIVLVFSSHDFEDIMTFEEVVGNVPFYPETQPATAVTDALSWISSRYFTTVDWNALPGAGVGPQGTFNSGWESFAYHCRAQDIPLLVYHHPTRTECEAGEWNEKGTSLQSLLAELGVEVVSGLEAPCNSGAYRDDIHPDAAGQAIIADALEPALRKIIADATD